MYSCLYFNARSLRSRLTELHQFLYAASYSIIAITETWLDDSFTDGLLDPKNEFNVYRFDRLRAHPGGGVCILVHKSLSSSMIEIDYDMFANIEIIAVNVIFNNTKITIGCTYIAPNTSNVNFCECIACLRQLCSRDGSLIMLGDFNLPYIDWQNTIVPNDFKSQELFNWSCDFGLDQFLLVPTRLNHILDLVFCNDPFLISELTTNPPFCTSDHDTVSFNIICDVDVDVPVNTVDNPVVKSWDKTDWQGFNFYCTNSNWFSHYSFQQGCTIDDLCTAFTNMLNYGIELFVPIRPVKKMSKKGRNKEYKSNKKIRQTSAKKRKLWKICKRSPSAHNRLKFKLAIRKLKELKLNFNLNNEKRILGSGNLGAFFKHVNRRLSHSNGISALKSCNGKLITSDAEKAELLNNFFVGVGVLDDGLLPTIVGCANRNLLSSIVFDEINIGNAIDNLKCKTSSGIDGFPPILFKRLKSSILKSLCYLFNCIIECGSIPSTWKVANVTPIFKKGSATDPGNYRPISIICVCSKIFEIIVKKNIVVFLEANNLINPAQHGFLAKHSTCTNLILSINDWSRNLDDKAGSLIAYVDFAKAFDSVSSAKLIFCLKHLGISGNLLKCLDSFLTGRCQRVKIGNCLSSVKSLVSGVPQGSVLGPILFIVFINSITVNLPSGIKSKIFADDLKTYARITDSTGVDEFVSALAELSSWADSWQLPISCGKSNWMFISNRKDLLDTDVEFNLAGKLFHEVKEIRDLGIIVDNNLSFSTHITTIIANAKKRLFLLHKSFITKDALLLLKAYIIYVRPLLEYCSQVWSPHLMKDINRIESVQRTFTKRLKGYHGLTYPERLLKANLVSLELRRLRADLVLCFSIVHKLVSIDYAELFELIPNEVTRGHKFKLRATKPPRLDTRLYFFGYRVVQVWNDLPDWCVDASNLKLFKRLIQTVDLSKHLRNAYDVF